MKKYKELFYSDCVERLENMGSLVVALEKEPKNRGLIDEIFRHAHSIKGMANTMGYENMSGLSHKIENLLDKVRKGDLVVDSTVADVVLRAHSVLLGMLSKINEEGTDHGFGSDMSTEIETIVKGDQVTFKAGRSIDKLVPAPALEVKDLFVKVRAAHLDRLIDIISEFMSLKWRLKNFNNDREMVELESELGTLEKLIRDMNEKVLSLRMIPINVLSGKLPRFVRDMARKVGKSVELEITGESIELDKNIIESLESPVIHLIRNCVDHGIETPSEREDLGKNPTGNIFFKGFRFQNRVIIEIGDDGRGMDPDRVAGRALEMGVVREQDLVLMDANRKLLLVCVPGLSTSEEVSSISGRGVGMDVVKSSIESLGGTLSIFSEFGRGTTFRIDLPLTTAIISVFVVEVNGVKYGIPSFEIERVVEITKNGLYEENGFAYYSLGDDSSEKINLYHLGEIFHSSHKSKLKEIMQGVIIKNNAGRHLLTVDGFCGIEEVIVKPLSIILKFINGISGVTILPTGSPMFILNTDELF